MVSYELMIAPVDYDTAFVARVRGPRGELCFPRSLAWLQGRQRPDGTWGSDRFHAHDRLVSTLAAILCLHEAEVAPDAVERAVAAIPGLLSRLSEDAHETIGFEVIAPRLLDQCRALGFPIPSGLTRERRRRDERLAAGASGTVMFSIEGLDAIPRQASALLGPSGSLLASPSATAAYLMASPKDGRARAYIEELAAKGPGVPAVYPIDSFLASWTCWHLDISGQGHLPEARRLRELSASVWTPRGASYSIEFPTPNSDDTALNFIVQAAAGAPPEPGARVFEPFMTPEGVRCYVHEYDASVSANANVLLALRAAAPGPQRDEWIAILLRFLTTATAARAGRLLTDKWHSGVTYATSHAAIATHGLDNRLCGRLIDALLEAQRPDGAWGEGGGTAEDVAYALCALCLTYQPRHRDAIDAGAKALQRLLNEPRPALWVGKSLYDPAPVVESAIDAARRLSERALLAG